MWRGHKARNQSQGHKNNPRPKPRTALPRTDPLEAKNRNIRSQGQVPRTQAQVFSKKKDLQKIFFQAIYTIFNKSKDCAVLESRTEQFLKT